MIFYLSKRTTGRVLIVLSLATIAINLAGQYRGIIERRCEVGFVVPSTPQAKQTLNDISQLVKSAGSPRGEAAMMDRSSIASKTAHEVRDIDAPRSLNRRLKEITFQSDYLEPMGWLAPSSPRVP